jgi:hypothetical protein
MARMTILLRIGLIALVCGFASASGLAQNAPARLVAMMDLTVPQERLPAGCNMRVIEPPRREVVATSPTGVQTIRFVRAASSMQPSALRQVTQNPWTGNDRRVLAELRQRVDGYGAVRMPDGPPLTSSETSAMLLQFADGVVEGYAATYAESEERYLGVWAVRFATAPAPVRSYSPVDGRGADRTFNIGLIRATLFGDGPCAMAIETHLRSLSK